MLAKGLDMKRFYLAILLVAGTLFWGNLVWLTIS
ncbi:hypothetical protein QO002_005764 [Pararhizobium capsulatum DSM 1112]|uniref:Uncharacterized protein n=1 Tax=Pararhizobium capsulatum DSM 1112 TaxID=1121113 RepID=A0ABU0C061_9HYPH|nr:hypothetical protein [Pararhizobium capsulatum DSM 1112]